jgi:ribosomal-protein-alanine N-acetyltransferase
MTQSLLLHTSRLTIVGINEINIPALVAYFETNAEHLKLGGGQIPQTEAEVRSVYDVWLRNIQKDTEVRFFLLYEERIIGIVGISNIVRGGFQAAYLGYSIDEAFQGKGYMTEGLEEIIAFAFSALNLHRLMANYRPDNLASGRVLEKLGFTKDGFAKDYLLVNGRWADHVLTSKNNPHWRADV